MSNTLVATRWWSFVFAALVTASGQAQSAITIEDALALALEKSPRLEVFSWDRRAADARIVQAGLRPNPELEIEFEDVRLGDGPAQRSRTQTAGLAPTINPLAVPIGNGAALNVPTLAPNSSSSLQTSRQSGARSGLREAEITLGISQTIEVGGKRAKRIRLAEQEREVAAWDYEAARADVLAETAMAFIDVVVAQDRLALERELLELAVESDRAAAVRVEAGKVSPLESNNAAIALANQRIAVTDAEHALNAARVVLASMWGDREPAFSVAVGAFEGVYPVPEFDTLAETIEENPDVERWATEIAAREAELALTRAKRIPDPTVRLGISSAGLADRDARALSVSRNGFELSRNRITHSETRDERLEFGVRWPLPVFNRNQGAIQEAEYRVSKAAAERRAAVSNAHAELARTYGHLAAAYVRAESLQQDVLATAQETFDKTRRGYEAGKFDYLDVLNAQRTLFQAREERLAAVAQFHKGVVKVERLSGVAVNPHRQSIEDDTE